MARIAYILLCHKDPDAVIAQAERLTAAGDCMAIHFDGRAPKDAFQKIETALAGNPNVTFARRRVKCGWGEWSLVEATLEATRAAVAAFRRATHFYLLSGDCMSIKSAEYAHHFLDSKDVDYIESFDFFESDWIKTGIKGERLTHRHFFNERKHKSLFYASLALQSRLGLTRQIPSDLQIMIGSQWWCLRRRTVEAVLSFCEERPDAMRFFRRTWIPDETFFQTVVRHVVPGVEIETRTLTLLMFTDYGMPVTFYNDHFDLLLTQDSLFARKISPEATDLKARLGRIYAETGVHFPISGEAESLYRFLAGRGRIGRRYAARFWEEAGHEQPRELLIVVCKKWHVAKRLMARIKQVTAVPGIDYLFNEEDSDLPDLGGIQSTLEKRTRHRRALIRMLFDYHGKERLAICLDPSMIDLMQDLQSDRSTMRMLEIECDMTDDYLAGHAMRVGLAGSSTPKDVIGRLIPTIRYDILHESGRLRQAGFPHLERIRQSADPEENAGPLARFLSISHEEAREITSMPHLFTE
ncbi:DUF5928 domain-containing protein [Tropicimonas sp. IMCC34011]|uniref:DUF5928 domain-containing protein n=1 Tax=Tropicimonas sp. IMCC34011 TaxID=2248759 RepID=UPI000E24A3FD|nr:DUF5928 domain-containing protein [Tropicimonas sp. IMCC34011]